MRRYQLVLALLLGACVHARPGEPRLWYEVKTDHFVIETNGNPFHAEQLALELERSRAVSIATWWTGIADQTPRLRIVLLATSDELRAFAPDRPWFMHEQNFQGFYAPAAAFGEPFALASAEQGSFFLRGVGTSHLLRSRIPRAAVWARNGLYQYADEIWHFREDAPFVVGSPSPRFLDNLDRWDGADLPDLLAASDETRTRDFVFQAKSWLLFFHLSNRHRPQLQDYLRRLAAGEEPGRAFSSAFPGLTVEQLRTEIVTWSRSARPYHLEEIPPPPYRGMVSERRMAPGEVHAAIAEISAFAPGVTADVREGQATDEARLALRDDPGQPRALYLLARTEALRPDETVPAYRRAAGLHPDDAHALALLASALRPKEDAHERRELLTRALQLQPDSTWAMDQLAWDAVRRSSPQEAILLARNALALWPDDVASLEVLAAGLARTGRCAEAAQTQQRALSLSREAAPTIQRRLDAYRAGCLELPAE